MKSNTEWQKWGERDPLFAVSAWPGKQRGEPAAWTDEEFYELGRSDWEDFYTHWQQYGVDRRHCIEIGCGAGRITKQLAVCFQHVTALDVSEHQLAYAKTRLETANVNFVLTNGLDIPLDDGTCTGAFSSHVFQHFDSHQEAYDVLREVHRVLRAGGTLMVHLPIYHFPDMPVARLFPPIISFVKRVGDLRAAANRRLLMKGHWTFVMRRLRFEKNQLISALRSIGFSAVEFRSFAVRSNGDYHEFAFATKRA